MASYSGALCYDTKIDTSGFNKGLNEITGSVKGAGSTIKNIVAALGIDKIISAGMSTISESVGSAMKRIDTMEQFTRVMTAMTGSTELANDALETIKDTVTGTAYGLDVAARSTQKFVTSGMGLDKSTQQVKTWADAVAFYGDGTNETFENVTDALAKMVAKGKVEMDQLNRLTDAGIPAVQIYADYVGKSVQEVQDSLSNGNISTMEFLDGLQTAFNEGTSKFASISNAAQEAGASWTGSFDNFKAAVTRGMVNIIDSIDEGLESIGLDDMRTLISKTGKEAEKVMQSIAKKIPSVIKEVKKLLPVIEMVGAGFVSWKIGNITQDMIKSVDKAKESLKKFATQSGQTANAFGIFKAALKTNPVSTVLTSVSLAITGFQLLSSVISEVTKETDKNVIAANKLAEEQKKLSEQNDANRTAREENISAAETESMTAEVLYDKLVALNSVQDKTVSQKQKMKEIVAELNTLIPDLNLQYDEEKDSLNQTTDAIRSNIEAQKDLILAKAAQENMEKIAKDIVKQETELSKAEKERESNLKKLAKAKEDEQKAYEEYEKTYFKLGSDEQKAYQDALEKVNKLEKALGTNEDTIKSAKDELKKLNQEFNNTSDYAEEAVKNADIEKGLANLVNLAQEAGVEIPKRISDGIKEGKYAVPESIEGLNTLISFDDALKKAKLDGKDIPLFISEGLLNGQYTIEEAVNEVQKVVDFEKSLKQAKKDGVAIPKNLAQNVKDGTISVEDAINELNSLIDFNEALKKAKKDGITIPKNLAKSIKDGSMSVEEATQILDDALEFDNLVDKAGKNGIEIPKKLIKGVKNGSIEVSDAIQRLNDIISFQEAVEKANLEGSKIPEKLSKAIANGEITVEEAIDRLNNWINFNEAISEANSAGYNIPNSLRNGILNGEISVEEAVNQMNNWIDFNNALSDAGQSGIAIPNSIRNGILNGQLSVQDAVNQMNNWIKFQAALEAANMSGAEIPKDLANGILNGQITPQEAIKQMNDNVGNEAMKLPDKFIEVGKKGAENLESTKGEYELAGRNVLAGVGIGIDNREEQSSVFGKIKSFANNLSSVFKNSLDINSPSKVFARISKYIPEGVAVGIEANTKMAEDAIAKLDDSIVEKMKQAVSIEAGKINANATIKANNSYNVIQLNANFDGSVSLDGRKVGQIITPSVSKVLKAGGIR